MERVVRVGLLARNVLCHQTNAGTIQLLEKLEQLHGRSILHMSAVAPSNRWAPEVNNCCELPAQDRENDWFQRMKLVRLLSQR